MATIQCPQCAGAVRAGVDEFCPSCGYPLFWEQADDAAGSQSEAGGSEMARLPGDDATLKIPPTASDPESTARPAPPPSPEPSPRAAGAANPEAAEPSVEATSSPSAGTRCGACGQANPAERVLCQRCGVDLRPAQTPPAQRPARVAAPSRSRGLIVALVVVVPVVVVLAVGAAWLLWPDPGESDLREPDSSQPVLRAGATGEDVRAWQEQLGRVGHPVEVDGVFGSATERATRALQTEAGLPADGVVDPATRQAMVERLE